MPTTKVAHKTAEVYPHLPAANADKLVREKLGANKTSSLADPVFVHYRGGDLTARQSRDLSDWNFCFTASCPLIQQHLDKRVSQLFIQAVLCYQTGYQFREGHTIHQGLGAHHIQHAQGTLAFEAAHSPTIPCLYATNPATGQESVFLYRSGFYDESNATIDLVKAVNEADSAMDWMDQNNSLRVKTVELLNRASRGEMTPEQVVGQFMQEMSATIDVAKQKAKKQEVRDVLQYYKDLAGPLARYIAHPEHIDRWLDLNMEDPFCKEAIDTVECLKEGTPVTREQIYQLIKSKIDQLPVVINQQRHQKLNENIAPANFYDLFYLTILQKIAPSDVRLCEIAIGMRANALKLKAKNFVHTRVSNEMLANNAAKIDQLVKELQPLFAHLKGERVGVGPLTALSADKKVSLRPGVYLKRYAIIRKDQEAQSAIKCKIDSIWHKMQKDSRAAHLEDFFYSALLEQAPTEEIRRAFCKLLSISGAELTQKIQEIKVNSAAHSVLEKYNQRISQLANEVILCTHEDARAKMGDVLQQITSNKAAQSTDILFYKRLLNCMHTPENKAKMERRIGMTEEAIDELIAKKIAGKKDIPAAEAAIQKQRAKIQEIRAVASEALCTLRNATKQFRRELMVELRLSHGMKQDRFKEIYKERFPGSPMSDGTMSNLENGIKPIDDTIIAQVSSIFGVSTDLFYPSHFAE
jgi:hypothetical protein